MFVRRALAIACTLAASAAGALTAATPATASHGSYSVSWITLPDGHSRVLRWNGCQEITYKVNLGALRPSRHEQALWEIRVALGEVTERTGFRFVYRGTTSEVPQVGSSPNQSAELVIAYATPSRTNHDLRGSKIARGGFSYYTWWGSSDGQTKLYSAITRGYVVIDTYDALTRLRSGFGYGATRGNMLLHEFGHVFGLRHVGDRSQMMSVPLDRYTPNNYGSGDTAGLHRVGKAQGCIAVPSWVSRDFT